MNTNIDISPRVLYEALGSKNIEVDSIVFAEQIKNSCDAHAKNITIDFSNYENNEITISDNGDGMNYNEIFSKWFLIGTNNKVPHGKYLGGKGIGRLSLFRICQSFTITTKSLDDFEYEFTLDKLKLGDYDTTRDIKISIKEHKQPKSFIHEKSKGTKIILKDLKQLNLDEVYIDLKNLISPGMDNVPIQIDYIYPKNFKEPKIELVNNAINLAPFKCNIEFEGTTLINYDFQCEFQNKLVFKNLNPNNLICNLKNLPNVNLGKITFKLYNFYFDPAFKKKHNIPHKNLTDHFLNVYQGISVYRENFKVYGHGKNDWLKLAEKRVEKPTKCIDNKITFGYINLSLPDSDNLEEKTSREGFIKNDYLTYFKDAVDLIIEQFNIDRVESKKMLNGFDFNSPFSDKEKTISEKSDDIKKTTSETKPPNHLGITTKNVPTESFTPIPTAETNPHDFLKKEVPLKKKTIKNTVSNKILIDTSFEIPLNTPEKIKSIIYELQKVNNTFIYSQGLLLRCLIDISTKYAQSKIPSITRNNDDLNSNIHSILNYVSNNKLLDKKYTSRIKSEFKTHNTLDYFNGIAHEYDYRPNYDDLKRIWNTFEAYINFCINK